MTEETKADSTANLRSNPPVYMNLNEAALYVGISPRKMWDEVAKRRVKAARIGTRRIFPRAELDRYLSLKLAAA